MQKHLLRLIKGGLLEREDVRRRTYSYKKPTLRARTRKRSPVPARQGKRVERFRQPSLFQEEASR